MDIETITALEEVLKTEKILQKHNLERIGIFGSFARNETANDIDFYIDSDDYRIESLIDLKKDLEKITEKSADIMLKEYANPIILHRAERDMKYVTR